MKKQIITICSIFLLIFLCSPFVLASFDVYVLDLEYADYFYHDYDSIEFVSFYAYWSSNSQTTIGTQIIIDEGYSSNFYFTEGERVGAGEGEGYIYDNLDLRNVFGTAWGPTRHSFVSYRPYFFVPGNPTIFGDLLYTQYDNSFKGNLSTHYHVIGVVPEVLHPFDITGSTATLKGYVHYPDDKQYVYPTTRCKFWNQDYIEWSFIYRESDTWLWYDINGAIFDESTFDSWERTNATASGNKCINEIYDRGSSQYEKTVTGLKSNTNYDFRMVVKWTDGSNSEVLYSDDSTHFASGNDGMRTFKTGTQDITSDIVAYYPANDTTEIVSNNNLEDVINGNNGTLTGYSYNHGDVSGGVTIEDGAMVFDGSTGLVNLGRNNLQPTEEESTTDNNFDTWSIYVKDFSTNDNTVMQHILDKSGGGNRGWLLRLHTDGTIRFFQRQRNVDTGANTWIILSSTTVLNNNEKYDITIQVRNYNDQKSIETELWVNGIKEDSSIHTNEGGRAIIGSPYDMKIGEGWGLYVNGSIDSVRIWNKFETTDDFILTENDIQAELGKEYAVKGDGLVAQYSGKDFAGTESNPTTIYDTNNIVKGTQQGTTALKFDGVDDKITIPDTNVTSFSVWVKPTKIGTQQAILSGTDRAFFLFQRNTNFFSTAITSTENIKFIDTFNVWYHLAGYTNGTSWFFYVNGVLEKEVVTSNTFTQLNTFGSTGAANWFNGAIDNVRIYDKALNETEILDLFYLDRPEELSSPEIETLNVLNFTNSWADLRGSVISDNGNSDMEGFFKYGINTSMESQTTPETVAEMSTLIQQISGLESGKTFYYKFCVNYGESQTCGDMLSFTTLGGEYSVRQFNMELDTELFYDYDTTKVNAYLDINTNMNYLISFAGIQKGHPSEMYQNNILIGSYVSDSFNGTYSNFFNRPLHAKYLIKGVLEINDTIILTGNTKEIIQGVYARTRETSGIGMTSATLRGEIQTDDKYNPVIPQQCTFWGEDNLTVYFRYSEVGTSNWRNSNNVTLTSSCGTGGLFSINVNDLINNTNYIYNVRFIYDGVEYSSLTTSIENPTQSFKTLSADGFPVVQTLAPSDITTSQAKLNGIITDLGNYSDVIVYFRYYTFMWLNTPKITYDTTTPVNYLLTNLPQNQNIDYYICAEYSDQTYCDVMNTKTFTTTGTSEGNVPVIETLDAINIGDTTAKLVGSIWDFGDYPQVRTYFEYTTFIDLTTSKTTWSGLGSPMENIKDLIPGTTFNYRLCVEYGTNFELSHCANEKTLTTTGVKPHTDFDPVTGKPVYTTPGSFNDMIQQILGSQSQQMKNLLAVVIVAMFVIMGFNLTKSMVAGLMMGIIGLIIAFILGLFGVWIIILITIMLSLPVVYYLMFNRSG